MTNRLFGVLPFLAALAAWGAPGAALGEEWAVVGGRARAMGGTGVATDRNPYWNPAAIWKAPKGKSAFKIADILDEFDMATEIGLEISAQGDVIAEGDDVVDLMQEKDYESIQARLDGGTATAEDIETALVLIKEVNDLNRRGEGVYANSGTSGYIKLGKNIGLVLGAFAWSGADPNFDLGILSSLSSGGFFAVFAAVPRIHTPASSGGQSLSAELQSAGVAAADANELSFLAETAGINLNDPDVRAGIVISATNTNTGGGGGTLYDNQSGFTLSGIVLQETGINVSLPLWSDRLAVGATLKLLHGISYTRTYVLKDLEKGKDLFDETYQDFRENRVSTFRAGLDLGVAARPIPMFTFGLVARNITRPEFQLEGPGSYRVDPQVRIGAAFQPFGFLTAAVDFDLIRNRSDALDGFYSQILGFGVELKPLDNALLGLAFRSGFFQNLAMKQEEPVYSAGISARLWAFELEIAGSSSLYFKSMADVEKKTTGDPSDPNPAREVDLDLPERMGLGVTLRFVLKF
jgi:hypothetical protein